MQVFIDEFVGALLQLVAFSLLPLIWWLVTAKKEENFFSWIGLKKGKNDIALWKILLMVVAVIGVYIGLMSLCITLLPKGITTAGSQFSGEGAIAIPAAFVYGYIRTGLSEEILFRGFLLKRISAKFGFATGNIVQALVFGLLHGIPFGLATGNVPVTILLTLLPGAFGWFEGWLNERHFEGSVIPSWLIHGTLNVITTFLAL